MVVAATVLASLGAAAPASAQKLSDERSSTLWAHPSRPAPVHARPAASARIVARLHPRTEDGFPEVYLALRSSVTPGGREWIQVRLPMRPNGSTGWVPRSALGRMRLVRTLLVVDRRALRATLYRARRVVWRSPVGIGKPSTPTPAGRFWVREKFPSAGGPIYGPYAIGTSAYSRLSDWPGGGVVGIHGTDQPWLIPGRPSHGCIRVPNAAVTRLYRMLPVGTPIRIR